MVYKWKLKFKGSKSKEVLFIQPRSPPIQAQDLLMNNERIPKHESHKHLGVILDSALNFHNHIDNIIIKCNNKLNSLTSLTRCLKSKHIERIYMSYILPHLEYGSQIFPLAGECYLSKLDKIHYRGALYVSGCLHGTNMSKVLKHLNWNTLSERREQKLLQLVCSNENNLAPDHISELFNQYRNPVNEARTRNYRTFILPARMSVILRNSTIPKSISLWNSLDYNIKNSYSVNSFKFRLKNRAFGEKYHAASTKLSLPRQLEILLNRARCDLLFKCQLYAHNFTTINDPFCKCGNSSQTTKHVLLYCPLLATVRNNLFRQISSIPLFDSELLAKSNVTDRLHYLLHGHKDLSANINKQLIFLTANFLELAVETLK